MLYKGINPNKSIALFSSDKDSPLVILDPVCYTEKINRLINDGISKGAYVTEEKENTLIDLKLFQNFISRNFK